MTTARRVATVTSLVVLLAVLAPSALAQGTYDARLSNCDSASCIINALLGGLVQVLSAGLLGLAAILDGIFGGFAREVLLPFLGIFGGFFTGLAASLGELGGSLFNGVGDSFRVAYETLTDSFKFVGPLAPVLATAVVVAVVGIIIWGVTKLFDVADNVLPGPLERINDDSDSSD